MFRSKGLFSSRLPSLFMTLLLFSFALAGCGVADGETPPEEAAAEETSPEEAAAEETPPEQATGEDQLPHAEEVLTAALAEAEKDGRLVFLHTGADW